MLKRIVQKFQQNELDKTEKDFKDALSKMQNLVICRLRSIIPEPIPNLSVNNPLKENILTLFVCIYSRTSLFICGKPGSSKTLSVNWILNAFSKSSQTEEGPLSGTRKLRCVIG